jgi:WD40 repeat protein
VWSLAFSPQGQTLVSGGAGGGIHVWNVPRGTFRKSVHGHTDSVIGVQFLPGAAGFISGSADESVRLWSAAKTSPPLVSMPAHEPLAFAVDFSPDGKWLASGGRDSVIALRNPATGEVLRKLSGHSGIVYDVAFSPDSQHLASAGGDGTVKLWAVDSERPVASYNATAGRFLAIRSVAFSPDGRQVASGSEDGAIRLWSTADQKVQHAMTLPMPVLCVNYSPDGRLLASCTGYNQRTNVPGSLRLWDPSSGRQVAELEGHTTEIKRVVFDATGERLASAGSDRSVFLWSVPERKLELTLQADSAVTSLLFLRDGGRLVTGENRGGVNVWDAASGAAIQRYAGHQALVPAIAVSPDQKRLATASHDGTIKLWLLPQ